MGWRAFAFFSLGVNILLAAVWLATSSSSALKSTSQSELSPQTTSTGGRTNVLLRRQFFSWQEVESPDYPTYITNLRNIGCPEQTIRDIIIADINGLFARRRAMELVTPDQQWWRSEPDTNVLQVALEKSRALEEER